MAEHGTSRNPGGPSCVTPQDGCLPPPLRGGLEGFGLPAGLAALLADARAEADGALFDDRRTLSRLIGRPTTPMAETVAVALAAL